MSIKEFVLGTVVTLAIGGTAYTVNQRDVVDNFASDAGVTQQEAQQYVEGVTEDELVPFTEVGNSFINDGNDLLSAAKEIDCVNFEYEWETVTLSCQEGYSQLTQTGRDEVTLGQSYIKLDDSSAVESDINNTISLIDRVNLDYEFEIIRLFMTPQEIDEFRKANIYNKSYLKAAIESN